MSSNNFRVTHEGLSVSEILSELEATNDDQERHIFVIPPIDGADTDVDSDLSDDDHEGNLNHLGRNILSSICEVQTACKDDKDLGSEEAISQISSPSSSSLIIPSNSSCIRPSKKPQRNAKSNKTCIVLSDSDSEDEPLLPKKSKPTNNSKTKPKNKTAKQLAAELKMARIKQWKSEEPNFSQKTQCDPTPCSDEAMECQTPLEFFSLFLTDDILNLIIDQSNLYAMQKNVDLNLTKEELLVVFGGLLMSGYAKYPNKRMYWSREDDVPKLLSESMRCNRFEQILRFLHLNDNTGLDPNDRLYKLKPIINALNTSFTFHGGLDEKLSVDESMIPYYGKHYAKQYIRGKPIRFGFKNWAICSSSGYLYAFEIYTGKNPSQEAKFGLGGDVVTRLLRKAEVPSDSGHKIFIDNFFTSVPLIRHLAKEKYCTTGTVRADRTEHCPLENPGDLKSKGRGSHDFRSSEDIMLVRWVDNSVVTAATNFENLSIGMANRWSREKRAKVQVPQPTVFSSYNKGMGGVDLMDQNVAVYRTRMRQRKWWWPIFVYLFDVCVSNAWILNKKLLPKDDAVGQLLKFRRNLALTLLKKHGKPSSQGKIKPNPLQDIRFDNQGHWPKEYEKQRRCGHCKKKASFVCSKCDIGLHPKCFEGYHSPQ